MYKKKSLFQRIKKTFQFDDSFFDEDDSFEPIVIDAKQEQEQSRFPEAPNPEKEIWMESEDLYGELSVDVYEQGDAIIIQSMVAGVKPEALEITISRDMVMIKGKRDDLRKIDDEQFYTKELYWGSFTRTIMLPQEIDPDLAEAVEKYGLLTLKLPKIDRTKRATLKVKSG
jgi:HSP20 family molecular chaperone IbpA